MTSRRTGRSRWSLRGARGQAAAEAVAATLIVALLGAALGVALLRSGLPQWVAGTVAAALGGERRDEAGAPPRLSPGTYLAAIAAARGDPGAYSLAGAGALLREELGDAVGAAALGIAIGEQARRAHPGWFDPRTLELPRPGSPSGARVTAAATGAVSVHVVTPAEEAEAGAPGRPGGWPAALMAAGEQAAGALAGRLHAVAGVAVDLGLLLGKADAPRPGDLPPGGRAGDAVLCQPYAVAVREGSQAPRVVFEGVRVGVLRAGALVHDALLERRRCA